MKISPPEKGCHTATYPSLVWQKTECVTVPPHPVKLPRHIQRKPVGDMPFNDVSAQAPSPGLIASSTGSFDSVTVTSETDQSPNRFSFQINTNLFTTPMCGSAP